MFRDINPTAYRWHCACHCCTVGTIDVGKARLMFWDLGGQEELQSLWDKVSVIYFPHVGTHLSHVSVPACLKSSSFDNLPTAETQRAGQTGRPSLVKNIRLWIITAVIRYRLINTFSYQLTVLSWSVLRWIWNLFQEHWASERDLPPDSDATPGESNLIHRGLVWVQVLMPMKQETNLIQPV